MPPKKKPAPGKKPVRKTAASPGVALENALVANPDDLGAHAAYADWLIEQGDPRGEFIQVQLALEDDKLSARMRKELQKREQALLKKHGRTWLGNLAEFLWQKKDDEAAYSFARGWLDHIGLVLLTGPMARALANSPQARLLSSLDIHEVNSIMQYMRDAPDTDEEGERDLPGLEPLVGAACLRNLRYLNFGNIHDLKESFFPYNSFWLPELDGLVPLVACLPNLIQLVVEGDLDTGRLFRLKSLHELKALQICFAREYPLEVLARNRSLGNLCYIMFHPLDGPEPALTLDGLSALVNSPHLKSLTKLRLHLTNFGDAGCDVIVRSGILERLEVLDLGFGNITDKGARLIAGCAPARQLQLLDLQSNALTRKGIAALRKARILVHAPNQHDPDDDAYLYTGAIYDDEME